MELEEYQRLSARTAIFKTQDPEYILMYLSMGLAEEAGEMIGKIKKLIRLGELDIPADKQEVLKAEAGDILWFLSQLTRVLGLSLDDVAQTNIKKLQDRVERNVLLSGEGDNR